MTYKIQHLFSYGWDDFGDRGDSDDGQVETFPTLADAQADLDEFIYETECAASRGDMDEAYRKEDFRIVPA